MQIAFYKSKEIAFFTFLAVVVNGIRIFGDWQKGDKYLYLCETQLAIWLLGGNCVWCNDWWRWLVKNI